MSELGCYVNGVIHITANSRRKLLRKGRCLRNCLLSCFLSEKGPVQSKPLSSPSRTRCVIALFFCTSLWGCVGATRLPVRAKGPSGSLQKNEIDLNSVRIGKTRREEVINQLGAINTGYSNSRLFWGRWTESKWGYWWVVGYSCNNCIAGDAHRKWRGQNLLVAFDEKGLVVSKQKVGDNEGFWQALHSHILESQPTALDFSQPIRISLSNEEPAALLLSQDRIEFERGLDRGEAKIQVPVANVVRFRHRKASLNLSFTCHILELSEETAFGNKIKICAQADQIGTLFQYLQQAGSPTMLWQ